MPRIRPLVAADLLVLQLPGMFMPVHRALNRQPVTNPMNPSASIPSIPSRENSPTPGGRLESIALGLLLTVACLPALLPQPASEAEAPKAALGDEAVHQPMESRSFPQGRSEVGRSSATRIRRMPPTIITAEFIDAEKASAPTVLVVETIPTVEIVPLATLPSTTSTLP